MSSIPFHEALEDCSRFAGKVPQASCLLAGEIPVIGQGKHAIEGFTNDSGLAFRGGLPVILFGDHTAVFKFIDYPFARGADGTKLFRPRSDQLDAKYAWHFLQTIQLPKTGYDRKTKYLEAIYIPLPPLEEQRRIAAILDKAQRLEQQAEEQITKLDYLACSIFDQVISESRDSDAVIDIALGDLSLLSGQYGAGCTSVPYDTALPRYVRITDIQEDGFLSSAKVSPSGSPAAWAGLELEPGDLLFARSGATVGKTYMHLDREGPCIFAGYLIRFRVDQRLAMPDYVYAFTRTEGYRKWVDRSQRAVAQPNINAKQYSELRIPLPSLEVQNSYCEKAKAILSRTDSCRQRLNVLRNLKLSLASNLIKP